MCEDKSSPVHEHVDEPCLGDFSHEVVERLLECDTKCEFEKSCCCTYNLITTHDSKSLSAWNLCEPLGISHKNIKAQSTSPTAGQKFINIDASHLRKSISGEPLRNVKLTEMSTSPSDSMPNKMYTFIYHDDIEQYIGDYRNHVHYQLHDPQVLIANQMNSGEHKIPVLRQIDRLMTFSDWVRSVSGRGDISAEKCKVNRRKRSVFEQNNSGVTGVPLTTHPDSRSTHIQQHSMGTCDNVYQQQPENSKNSTLSSSSNNNITAKNAAKTDPCSQCGSNNLHMNSVHGARYTCMTNTDLRTDRRVEGKSCHRSLHVLSPRSNSRASADRELIVRNYDDRVRVPQTFSLTRTKRALARCQIGPSRSTWLMNKNLCHAAQTIPSLRHNVLEGVQSFLTTHHSRDKAGISVSDQQSMTYMKSVLQSKQNNLP